MEIAPLLDVMKEFGPWAGLVVLLLYAIEKTGLGTWLRQAHRTATGSAVREREILSADWETTLQRLRNEIVEERATCNERISTLENRHQKCEEELRELRAIIGERDRVRALLVDEIIELRRALKAHGVPLNEGNRLAELIASEEIIPD